MRTKFFLPLRHLNSSLRFQLFQHPVDGLFAEVANLHEVASGEVLSNKLRESIDTDLPHAVQGAHEVLVITVQEVVELHVLHRFRLLYCYYFMHFGSLTPTLHTFSLFLSICQEKTST